MQDVFIMSLGPKDIYSKQKQLCSKPRDPTTISKGATDCIRKINIILSTKLCDKIQQGLKGILIKMQINRPHKYELQHPTVS